MTPDLLSAMHESRLTFYRAIFIALLGMFAFWALLGAFLLAIYVILTIFANPTSVAGSTCYTAASATAHAVLCFVPIYPAM